MAQCPQCKEDLPLLSKICPVCGYVVESGESTLSPEECVDKLEQILLELKSIRQPSLLRSLREFCVFVYPLLAVFMLVVGVLSAGMLFWLLFVFFGILSLMELIRKIWGRGDSDAEKFRLLKNQFEYYERQARRQFGSSREVATLLGDVTAQIADMESARKNAVRRNILIWSGIIAVIVIAACGGVFSVNKAVSEDGQMQISADAASWQQEIEAFKASPENTPHGDVEARTKVLSSVLAQGQDAAAETFFFECCQKCVGDFDCAQLLIRHYLDKGDRQAALHFVERIEMRYPSDKNKLQKLIN